MFCGYKIKLLILSFSDTQIILRYVISEFLDEIVAAKQNKIRLNYLNCQITWSLNFPPFSTVFFFHY